MAAMTSTVPQRLPIAQVVEKKISAASRWTFAPETTTRWMIPERANSSRSAGSIALSRPVTIACASPSIGEGSASARLPSIARRASATASRHQPKPGGWSSTSTVPARPTADTPSRSK